MSNSPIEANIVKFCDVQHYFTNDMKIGIFNTDTNTYDIYNYTICLLGFIIEINGKKNIYRFNRNKIFNDNRVQKIAF